jgi:hypothetical protein
LPDLIWQCSAHPVFPCALSFFGRTNLQNSGKCCREDAYVRHRPRRRTIQHSATPAMESRTRGVLDTRLRGYDGGGWLAMTTLDVGAVSRETWHNQAFLRRRDEGARPIPVGMREAQLLNALSDFYPCENHENCLAVGQVNHAQDTPRLNPHLTKSRLNDAPRLCEMLHRNFFDDGVSRAGLRSKLPPFRRISNAAWKGNKVEPVWMQVV